MGSFPKRWNRNIFQSSMPWIAPAFSFGMIEIVPVVPEDVITSSGVCASSRSIHSSMLSQPATSTRDRSWLVSVSSHFVIRSKRFLSSSEAG